MIDDAFAEDGLTELVGRRTDEKALCDEGAGDGITETVTTCLTTSGVLDGR